MTIGIVYELGKEALLFFQMPDIHLLDTITSTRWQPHTGEFGIWGLVTATFMTSSDRHAGCRSAWPGRGDLP